jgi:hypothetical protein
MHVYSSVFHDSAYPDVSYGPPGTSTVDCAVSPQGGNFTAYVLITRSTRSDTPGFAGANDYRPAPTSLLVDYCDASAYAPAYPDLDRRPRCEDSSGKTNTYGACDAGAFELAPPPDVIFADGFESGDTSAWSAATGALGVNQGSALRGTTHGLEASIAFGSSHHVRDDTPSNEARYRARLYFDPNGFDPGSAEGHNRIRLLFASDADNNRLVTLVLRRLGAAYSVRARVRLADGTRADTPFFTIDDGPHFVEIDWTRSSSPGSGDGQCELRIDGSVVSTLTGLNHGAAGVESVRMGALSVKSGAAGSVRFDEFSSRRRLPIGP